MRNTVILSCLVPLVTACVILDCGKSKKITDGTSELGAVQVRVTSLNPAAEYSIGAAMYRFKVGDSVGWPVGDTVLTYGFDESEFLIDSLEPGDFDLWIQVYADTDGNDIVDPLWVPTLVRSLHIGRDSLSRADVPPSGRPAYPVWDPPFYMIPMFVEWQGEIGAR